MLGASKKVRVLIADDSALMRQQITRMLGEDPRIDLIGAARDGEEAVAKAVELRPDVAVLDINMPRMDGLTALQHILAQEICPVIVFSSLTQKGAVVTFEALELGAFDYLAKPEGTISQNLAALREELVGKILAAAASKRQFKPRSRVSPIPGTQKSRPGALPGATGTRRPSLPAAGFTKVVMIGVSTGGPVTVMDILPFLPADFPAPVFLIQHMPPRFTSSFAERLNKEVPMRVVEASHREMVEAGTVYVGPGGKHMLLERPLGREGLRIALSDHPEDTAFKPSVNVSMHSLLKSFPARNIVAVLLTGIGDDGADAMVAIKQAGGFTIAEAEETAVVYGMPRAAAERGGATIVLPSHQIAAAILQAVHSV